MLRNFRLGGERDQILLAEDGRRARREGNASRRFDALIRAPLFDEALVLGDVQYMAPVLARIRLVQHQAAAIVLNDLLQRRAHRRKHVVHVQVRDDGVVHFQQETQPIAFSRELHLHGAGALVVQDIVDGNGNLFRHLLHERDVGIGIHVRLQAATPHSAEAAERRGQGHQCKRLHAVFSELPNDRESVSRQQRR